MPLFDKFADIAIGTPGSEGVVIKGLRVQFKIAKTVSGAPNIATIVIYNLSADIRNAIKANRDVILLRAGYRDAPDLDRLCCQMDIFDVRTEVAQPETVTTIQCGDGINAVRNSKLTVTYKRKISVKEVIQDIASQIGSTLRNLTAVKDATYANGFSESGPVGDLFDKLAGKIGANWSFQNSEVEFAPKDGPNVEVIVEIAKDSGLIGTPVRRNKTGAVNVPALKDGWMVKSLLNPVVQPNGRVRIISNAVNAIFRAVTVVHTGDTDGQEWYTDVEAEEYD